MKNLVLTIALILPFSTFAETISFRCTSVEYEGAHKFDAHGIINVDDLNNVEGIANVITQKAGAIQSAQTFDDVHVTGYIRHFNAGELANNALDQVVLKTDAYYLKTLNLLLGIDQMISSRASSIDNFSYRSNCKVISKFN